jgi:hypothetical protein
MNKRERISDFVRSLDSAPSEGSSQNYYAAYFQLWNTQKYYEAHDVLEQLWLGEKNAELARFYQALIQAAWGVCTSAEEFPASIAFQA